MPKVSVIIPILNVEPYLKECLDSVVNQTLEDIEIFCVDAGSTDGSVELQRDYAARDSRIVLLDDIKKSTGYAKNLGIDQASGEYVAIVESDDYIETDMYEKLYFCAKQYDADLVKGNYASFIGEGRERRHVTKSIALNRDDYGRLIDPRTDNRYFAWEMYTWNGIYKKAFLEKYRIRHHESPGASYQDVGFWFQTFCYAEHVYLLPDVFYHYRRDNPNASVNNPNRLYTMCDEYDFLKRVLIQDEKTWRRTRPAFYRELFRSYFSAYKRLAPHLRSVFVERFHNDMLEGKRSGGVEKKLFEEREWRYAASLLDSGGSFEMMCSADEAAYEERQLRYVERLQGLNTIIFGAGSHGQNLQIMLEDRGYQRIAAFCDNDEKKQGRLLNNIKVLSPEEAVKRYPNGMYTIANKLYGDQIYSQLLTMGIPESQIILCDIEDIIRTLL